MGKYYVNKNLILGSITAKEKTVSDFCKENDIDRSQFYVALNRAYRAPRSVFITKVANALKLNVSLVWEAE